MHYYEIAPTIIVRSDQSRFTYSSDTPLSRGTLVRIPVGKKETTGLVLEKVDQPHFPTKSVLTVLESEPLPGQLIELALWLSEYYATHLAIVLQTILPAGLHKKRRQRVESNDYPSRKRATIVLNSQQKHALEQISTAGPGTILLKGVTGSGKTQIYIETAKKLAKKNLSSIILVPEISLTPQLIAEFKQDFASEQLILTHSAMTEAERHMIWKKCLYSTSPLIVIGPRSALFSPLKKLGLIVIDESHEPSFKQEQSPRYSAARAATMLSRFASAQVILGSATPSVGDYYLAQASNRPVIELTKPAIADAKLPRIHLVAFQTRQQFSEHRFFSKQLLAIMRTTLAARKQILLFHNRRGTAPLTVCTDCGWSALCPQCFIPLTLHTDKHLLVCHLCAYKQPVPHTCPQCHSTDIIHKGIGTKLVAEELHSLFPKARIARFDADNTLEESLAQNYQALYDGDIQIIIGTQLIAKGLDLPHLRAVGVLQADSGLFLPDHQAEERVFQLLYQVVGRVGRSLAETDVVVQTYQPTHPAIQLGLHKDYESFYRHTLQERKQAHFPPFTHLLKLTCVYNTEAAAIRAARNLAVQLQQAYPKLQVLGPTPAFHERLGDTFRWQLLLKSQTRATLQQIAVEVPKPWQADLDPHSLL